MIVRQEDIGASIVIDTPHGPHAAYFTGPELAKYPTKEARGAAFFGMSPNQYREWLHLGGNALCAGRTKDGARCGSVISGCNSAEIWLAIHRKCHCDKHRPEPKMVMSAFEQWKEELRDEFCKDSFMTPEEAAEAADHDCWHEWFLRSYTPRQAVAHEKDAREFWAKFDSERFAEDVRQNPELLDILKAAHARSQNAKIKN